MAKPIFSFLFAALLLPTLTFAFPSDETPESPTVMYVEPRDSDLLRLSALNLRLRAEPLDAKTVAKPLSAEPTSDGAWIICICLWIIAIVL